MHVLFIFFFLFLHYRASLEESAYGRIKQVLRWYLSGFYKKPKVSYVHAKTSLYSSVITLAELYDKPDYKMHIHSVPVRDYSDILFLEVM